MNQLFFVTAKRFYMALPVLIADGYTNLRIRFK